MKEHQDFKASRGWFHKFQKRCARIGLMDAAGAEAARQFVDGFRELISEGNYLPQQVFNAAEMCLHWRRMPPRTSIYKMDRLRNKMSHDRVSLLLCGNAIGDFTVKPMMVTRTLKPQLQGNRNMVDLPIYWQGRPSKSNKNPVITADIFFEWLQDCFIPEVTDYLRVSDLPPRVLLLIDPQILEGCKNLPMIDTFVEFEFFPAHTARLLQPLGHTVLPTFACNYLHKLMSYMMCLMDVNPDYSLYKLWSDITIVDCIELIQESIDDINADCWNSGWALIWNEIVRKPFQRPTFAAEVERIIEIGHNLPGAGFADMTKQDIARFLKKNPSLALTFQLHGSFDNIITDEVESDAKYEEFPLDLDQCFFYDEATDAEEPENRDEDSTTLLQCVPFDSNSEGGGGENSSKLSLRNIKATFNIAKELIEHIQSVDPNRQRSQQFEKDLKQLLQPYIDLKESMSQRSIRDYFSTTVRRIS